MRPSFFHHLHPPTIPARQARLRYTLGAGGLSVYLILVIFLTGILEMFYYIPTPERAGASIQMITFLVPYGNIVRNLHYWAAQLLVGTVLIHFLRVVFTGAYAPPRRFNYLLGLALLVLVVFLDFTGFVLRWDEGVRWALVAGTNLIRSIPGIGEALYFVVMGGDRPGPSTLIRFYAWHIFGLTVILLFIGVWHIFRVRRDGGIAVPPPDLRKDHGRISRFDLVRQEALAAIIATCALLLLATFVPAPLKPPITEQTLGSQVTDSLAPWFFRWVQELLLWGSPFLMGIVVPLGILAVLALIPYVLPTAGPEELGEWWPRKNRLAQILVAVLAIIILALTLYATFKPPAQG